MKNKKQRAAADDKKTKPAKAPKISSAVKALIRRGNITLDELKELHTRPLCSEELWRLMPHLNNEAYIHLSHGMANNRPDHFGDKTYRGLLYRLELREAQLAHVFASLQDDKKKIRQAKASLDKLLAKPAL